MPCLMSFSKVLNFGKASTGMEDFGFRICDFGVGFCRRNGNEGMQKHGSMEAWEHGEFRNYGSKG